MGLFGLLTVASEAMGAPADRPVPGGSIEVVAETSGTPPYPGEMVLLRVRSTFVRLDIAREELQQPALEHFAWMQLGRDGWTNLTVDGKEAVRFERDIAIFPERAGRLAIDPFVHRLTFVGNDNLRHEGELRSAPLDIEVSAWPASTGGPDGSDWWLPARTVTVTDHWEPEPDRLAPGETARRTVVIEADGIGIERLPPAPKLHGPGVITFAGPVERRTLLTPTGPIARAVYRWDVRPATAMAATLDAVHIPWFDTKSRRMQDAILPARRVALSPDAGGNAADEARSTRPGSRTIVAAQLLTGIAVFLAALARLVGEPVMPSGWRRRHPDQGPRLAALDGACPVPRPRSLARGIAAVLASLVPPRPDNGRRRRDGAPLSFRPGRGDGHAG